MAWTIRINQPKFTSWKIWETEKKEIPVSAEKFIAKKIPVKIWITKHSPSKEPKFHNILILTGTGKSTAKENPAFIKGLFFKWCLIIIKTLRSFNWKLNIIYYTKFYFIVRNHLYLHKIKFLIKLLQ